MNCIVSHLFHSDQCCYTMNNQYIFVKCIANECFFFKIIPLMYKNENCTNIINRPGVAGAVLQTPQLLIH